MTNETASSDTCISRRSVLSGASALALATAALRMRSVLAQDGTPVATPTDDPSWLFTQGFSSGDWDPTDDPASYVLNLRGGLASTFGFTDRPHRDFALFQTSQILPNIFYDPTNPPNAAIVIEEAGTQYTFLLVLNDPVYDEAADQVTYLASVLESYEGDGLSAAVAREADGTLPQSFGTGALFIDSIFGCKDSTKACRRYYRDDNCRSESADQVELGHLAGSEQWTTTCYTFMGDCNLPCPDGTTYYDDWCNATYPDWCYERNEKGCVFATDDFKISCTKVVPG